ncbi:MAG: DUF1566 domain-containing protein [Deltaproteobacteria bacterium]|nr:DUF1566 domain-containing protein [Deltaproteobacteria bacterium]
MLNLLQQKGIILCLICAVFLFNCGLDLAQEPRPVNSNNRIPYVVVDTGQDKCYNNGSVIDCPRPGERFYGQDAQYNGVEMSYRNNGDGTVTDLNTGLTWQKTPPQERLSWDNAMEYAGSLELGGHDDWRLPTIKELYSILASWGNMKINQPYINSEFFDCYTPGTSGNFRPIDGQYWSSTRYVGTTMRRDLSAFGYNFTDGRIKSYPVQFGSGKGGGASCYVRCVRGNSEYGKNKFVDNGDRTITDLATGLMWMKADSSTGMNWEKALEYAENLEYAGYNDWRLPNVKELHSIVDYRYAPDARDKNMRRPAIDPVFELTKAESWFWSSTTFTDSISSALYICFGQGFSAWKYNGVQMNAHGAGAQRSDPKKGNPSFYSEGHGPQGDEIRINNYVRCVRN